MLGGMLIGLGALIRKFSVVPHSTTPVLAQLTEASLGQRDLLRYSADHHGAARAGRGPAGGGQFGRVHRSYDRIGAVTVVFADPGDEAADVSFRRQWEAWHPHVELVTLRSAHRSMPGPSSRLSARWRSRMNTTAWWC